MLLTFVVVGVGLLAALASLFVRALLVTYLGPSLAIYYYVTAICRVTFYVMARLTNSSMIGGLVFGGSLLALLHFVSRKTKRMRPPSLGAEVLPKPDLREGGSRVVESNPASPKSSTNSTRPESHSASPSATTKGQPKTNWLQEPVTASANQNRQSEPADDGSDKSSWEMSASNGELSPRQPQSPSKPHTYDTGCRDGAGKITLEAVRRGEGKRGSQSSSEMASTVVEESSAEQFQSALDDGKARASTKRRPDASEKSPREIRVPQDLLNLIDPLRRPAYAAQMALLEKQANENAKDYVALAALLTKKLEA